MKNLIFYPWQLSDAKRIVKPLLRAKSLKFKENLSNASKEELFSRSRSSSLPQSVLLYGAHGIGKFRFSLSLCQVLLCEKKSESNELSHPNNYACGVCQSCQWFKTYSHPDFHLVLPENQTSLMTELYPPYVGERIFRDKPLKKTTSSAPGKEIKVDQIRILSEFARISPQCSGLRIAMIYSAENLNSVASNMLLKLIEEPPKSLMFVIVGKHPSIILPTIVSRCFRISLTYPTREDVKNWLIQKKCSEVEQLLAWSSGAPLLALHQEKFLRSADFYQAVLVELSKGKDLDIGVCSEGFGKMELDNALIILQRWIIDLTYRTFVRDHLNRKNSYKIDSMVSNPLQYFLKYSDSMSILAKNLNTLLLSDFYKKLMGLRSIAKHSLNVKLTIEMLLFDYISLFP